MARNYWFVVVIFSIIITIGLGGCVQPTFGESTSEEFQKTYEVDAGTVLKVYNINGKITVTTWGNDSVEVYALKVSEVGQSELDKVSIEVSTGAVMVVKTIHKSKDPRVSVDYRIKVPADVSVEHLETTNGAISLEGTTGDATLISTNGDINVKDVDGSVRVTTTNGNIEIKDVTVVRGVKTTNGKITVEIPAITSNLEITSTNGDVTVYVPEDLDADIVMKTTNGKVTVHDIQLDIKYSSDTHVEGTMGNGGYDLNIQTTNGNIDLYKLEGVTAGGGAGGGGAWCLGTLLIAMFSVTAAVSYGLVQYRKRKLT